MGSPDMKLQRRITVGKQGGERAWVVAVGRVGLGPRGESVEGSMSAWFEVRAAERTSKMGRGLGW